MPMSEPKPLSVTTKSPSLSADEVGDERVVAVGDVREGAAVDERRLTLERLDEVRLQRVLEQHGHRACRVAAASAVTGSPSKVWPTVIAPSRRRRSWRSRATATIAITSEAAVMSKPVSRT